MNYEKINEDKKTNEKNNNSNNKRCLPSEVSTIDTNSKRHKELHTSCLKLSKTPCDKFVGKNHAFTEDISAKLVTRLIDSGLLSTEKDGGHMDERYNCSEKTHLIRLRKKIKNGVLNVIYKAPKSGYGRVEPRGCLSLGSLRKEFG